MSPKGFVILHILHAHLSRIVHTCNALFTLEGRQRRIWMSILWLWHPRELRLLQGGICGRLWQIFILLKEGYAVSVTNIFHIKRGTNNQFIPVLFLWSPYSFSIQNAEAALLHGADVKDMIEEPMKVGRGIFLADTSGQNICKKTKWSWFCPLAIRLSVPVGSSWMWLDLRCTWSPYDSKLTVNAVKMRKPNI